MHLVYRFIELPDPDVWALNNLSHWQRGADGRRHYTAFSDLLDACGSASTRLSDELSRLHFSHADQKNQSL